jgi:predicted MPP superfamily phosphohydrolase
MPKVDLVSDLHLECKELTLPGGDILVIAGDAMEFRNYLQAFHSTRMLGEPTDRFLRFFEVECAKYQTVLYLPGNHEFYGSEIESVLQRMQSGVLPDNVRILDRSVYDAGDVLFVGATLWTNCNNGDWYTHYHLKRCMNDFHVIKYKEKRFTTHDMIDLHNRDFGYIKTVVEQNADRKIFVATHHTPSFINCAAKYANDKLMNGGYHTELSEFILDHTNITHWAFGHTHEPFDHYIGTCRLVCNPRGYWPHEGSKGYVPKTIM